MSDDRLSEVDAVVDGEVGIVTIRRPPHNFLDADLVADLVDALRNLEGAVGAVVLRSEGRNFCAGADVTKRTSSTYSKAGRHLYDHALDLYAQPVPVVAAVQGKAVGGGLGVALTADLRVGNERTTFLANFAALGIHPGFAISVVLPHVVGSGHAADMLLTSRPVSGEEALRFGLLDRLVEDDDPFPAALELARQIAAAPASATLSVRATLRARFDQALAPALAHERAEQERLIALNMPSS